MQIQAESETFPVKFAYARTGFSLVSCDGMLVCVLKLTVNLADSRRSRNVSRLRQKRHGCCSGGTRCDHQAQCFSDLEQENCLFLFWCLSAATERSAFGEEESTAQWSFPKKCHIILWHFTMCKSCWISSVFLPYVDTPRGLSDMVSLIYIYIYMSVSSSIPIKTLYLLYKRR
jgi:hypothetical protein